MLERIVVSGNRTTDQPCCFERWTARQSSFNEVREDLEGYGLMTCPVTGLEIESEGFKPALCSGVHTLEAGRGLAYVMQPGPEGKTDTGLLLNESETVGYEASGLCVQCPSPHLLGNHGHIHHVVEQWLENLLGCFPFALRPQLEQDFRFHLNGLLLTMWSSIFVSACVRMR